MLRRALSPAWLIGLGLLLAALAACQTTRPYQREILAKPVMALDDMDPEAQALLQHLRGTREGAAGTFGGGGGGCGCN